MQQFRELTSIFPGWYGRPLMIPRCSQKYSLPPKLIALVHRLKLTALFACAGFSLEAQETKVSSNSPPEKLPPVTVFGRRPSLHDVASESDLVGPAHQPEWTTRRAFAETDIYVIPSGEFEFNQFYELEVPRHGKAEHGFESEFEFGLPWRTQFDVELLYGIEDGRLEYQSTRLEVPHALANWGKIPLNPAIGPGWRFNNQGADSFLVRLLLAEEFGDRFHFGGDFGYEQQVDDERETEYELNLALSYVAINKKLTVGFEFLFEHEAEKGHLSGDNKFLLGPSILYKPTRDTHLGLVAMAGLTHDSPMLQIFLIFGFDLEPFTWNWGGGKSASDYQPSRRPR